MNVELPILYEYSANWLSPHRPQGRSSHTALFCTERSDRTTHGVVRGEAKGTRLTKSSHSPQLLQSRHGYSDPERKGSREAGFSSDHQAVPPNLADGSCLGSELLKSVSQMSRVEVCYSRGNRWDCPDFTHDEGEWSMDHPGNARRE